MIDKHKHNYYIRLSTQVYNFAKNAMASVKNDFIIYAEPSEVVRLTSKHGQDIK